MDDGELTTAEVFDNSGCAMEMGTGSARELAVVVVQSGNGALFSVFGEAGQIHGGKLPFIPGQYRVGERADGSVVTGFGDLRLHQGISYRQGRLEPVRVYIDDQIVYENDKVWDFGVANDGSSFFAIEPLGGGSSRLLIHNLDQGTIEYHDLGKIFASDAYDAPYRAAYAVGKNEVHVQPFHAEFTNGVGVHYFFPISTGEQERSVRVPNTGPDNPAFLMSSEEGYFFYDEGDSGYLMAKRSMDWSTGETVTVWEQRWPLGIRANYVRSTSDGAWLLIGTGIATSSRPVQDGYTGHYVLEAMTGETAFVFPGGDQEAQFKRLASTMRADAKVDEVGTLRKAFFVGDDQLVIQRIFWNADQQLNSPGIYDVYDLRTLQTYGTPNFQVAFPSHNPRNPCAPGSFPGELQAREDGRLAYITKM